jgi:hypothetical protein
MATQVLLDDRVLNGRIGERRSWSKYALNIVDNRSLGYKCSVPLAAQLVHTLETRTLLIHTLIATNLW